MISVINLRIKRELNVYCTMIADISFYRTMQKNDCEVYESRFNVTLSRYILLSVSHKSFMKK